MKKTQIKNALRTIRKSIVSWLAISVVVTLCCGIYFGVIFYADSMEDDLYDFAKSSKMEDFNIIASQGLRSDEIKELKDVDGIDDAEGTWRLDDSSLISDGKESDVDIYGLTDRISLAEVKKGELPDKDGECALTHNVAKENKISIGDKVKLSFGGDYPDDFVKSDTFKVTAIVDHPDCISDEYGDLVLLPKASFKKSAVSNNYSYIRVDADLAFDDSVGLEGYKDSVSKLLKKVRKELKSIGKSHDKTIKKEIKQKYAAAAMAAGVPLTNQEQKIEEPEKSGFAFVTRDDMEGYDTMKEDISHMKMLGLIFFVIFALIAAVVILSTITIIIDSNKKLIGTMKAFGFVNSEIIKGYLVFGLSASLCGMLFSIGLAVLFQQIIKFQISPLFVIKPAAFTFEWKIYATLLILQIAIAAVATILGTIVSATRHSAVALMNNTAGKKVHKGTVGTRKKGALYSRLIHRNMRTDIVRVIVSIIIIAGSCLVMGDGVTLQDAFSNMMDVSAENITHYDMEIKVTGRCDKDAFRQTRDYLNDEGLDFEKICKTTTVYSYDGKEKHVILISGKDDIYPDHIELTDMDGDTKYDPSSDGILISNRISEQTGLKKGTKFRLFDGDYQPRTVKVGAVCKNYFGNIIYVSEDDYKHIYGEKPENNTFLVEIDHDKRDSFKKEIQKKIEGLDASYTNELPDSYDGLKKVYNIIVYVVIGLSALMSLFVLMNLVNIFVRRRQNEIIIMAVNGFTWKEQRGYLIRESVATILIGLLFGVLGGYLMTDFLVKSVEHETVMFIREFDTRAWIFAVVLELIFALIINLISYRNLRKLKLTDITK